MRILLVYVPGEIEELCSVVHMNRLRDQRLNWVDKHPNSVKVGATRPEAEGDRRLYKAISDAQVLLRVAKVDATVANAIETNKRIGGGKLTSVRYEMRAPHARGVGTA